MIICHGAGGGNIAIPPASTTMAGEGRGKLFLLAPLGISLLHCVLVFYPFHVDCVVKQDRLAWARSVGGYKCMV